MSHVVDIDLEVKNLPALKAACKRLGFEFHENQTSFKWYGRWVGDTTLPKGFLSQPEQDHFNSLPGHEQTRFATELFSKSDHAISVPGMTYQIGVAFRHDRWHLLFDYFQQDTGALGGQDAPLLKQAYGVEAARLEALALGHTVTEHIDANGDVRLRIHVGS